MVRAATAAASARALLDHHLLLRARP